MNINNQNNQTSNIMGNTNYQCETTYDSVIGTRKNIEIIDSYDYSKYGIHVEVIEYQKLLGCTNINAAQSLWFMNEENIRCRQVALYLDNSAVKTESGAMSYYQGNLECTTGVNSAGKLINQMITGKLTGERTVMPEYRGSGLLVLEPSFKHFVCVELEQGERLVCDNGMFYAASSSVAIQPCFAGGITGTIAGGEGIFQQEIIGPGLVVLELPVPMCEVNKVKLNNDVLKVDGNFALLRAGNIGMNVERSSKTLIGSAINGEGLVNVYRGTGEVWLAPTLKVYDAIALARNYGGNITSVNMNTGNGKPSVK